LRDTTEGGDTEAAEMFETRESTEFADSFIRKHRPKTFLGKVGHLFSDEVNMVLGRFL